MKQISGKEFCKLLEKYGWELKRIQGSHFIYSKEGSISRLSIPVHKNQPLKLGLLKSLLKLAEIKEEDL